MPRLPCDDSSDLGNIVGLLVVLTCVPLFAAILLLNIAIDLVYAMLDPRVRLA